MRSRNSLSSNFVTRPRVPKLSTGALCSASQVSSARSARSCSRFCASTGAYLSAVTGSGAREFCLALYGLLEKTGGKVTVCGQEANIRSATDALKYKICLVPQDRHAEGIVPIMSVKENIGLSCLKTSLRGKLGLLDGKKETQLAEDYVKDLAIKTQSIYAPSGSLSGGNQQKVVLGKVLAVHSSLLILDEPTIGIDIKSREEIMGLIKGLTEEGLSVIYLTNDFDELLRIVDRVVIFNDGRIVGDMKNENLTSDMVVEIRDGRTV